MIRNILGLGIIVFRPIKPSHVVCDKSRKVFKMKIDFNIEDLYDEDGEPADVKRAIRNSVIDNISHRVLRDLSKPSYQLKQNAEKLIKENIHTLVAMGMEKFLQEKCSSINDVIDSKIEECFNSSDWNNDGLPNVIRAKIKKIIEKKTNHLDSKVTSLFEENFKIVLEEILDVAFKRFVENAGINTIWVSGKERIKAGTSCAKENGPKKYE